MRRVDLDEWDPANLAARGSRLQVRAREESLPEVSEEGTVDRLELLLGGRVDRDVELGAWLELLHVLGKLGVRHHEARDAARVGEV